MWVIVGAPGSLGPAGERGFPGKRFVFIKRIEI
jgi:hypothetical protein